MTGYVDGLREECGVFGIVGHPHAARMTHLALYALQHRGQESAGIAVADGGKMHSHKGMGLVADVFDEDCWDKLPGKDAIGHVRYSTFGASLPINVQPLVFRYRGGSLAIAHNGNIVNAPSLRKELEELGSIFQTGIDTEVIAHLIARSLGKDQIEAVIDSLRRLQGAFSVVILTDSHLIAARDPHGIRPLSLGDLDGCPVVASETCAFDVIGAKAIGDIEPGELVIVTADGIERRRCADAGRHALCAFEFIYFARPDSVLRGLNVHAVRKELGRQLARQSGVEADLVTGVPDSSLSAASGYAEAAGIPYELGFVKNRYIGRTFIQPSAKQRQTAVRIKLNPLRKVIEGNRVVLVDDSIVRGTTSQHIVRMLKESGARAVHLRISSPPYKYSCHYGIDTAARGQLIAATHNAEEIRQMVGADSLEFLSLEALLAACGGGDFCTACFTGDYPAGVGDGLRCYEGE